MSAVSLSPLSGSKGVLVKSFTIARTDTTAALKLQLPEQASILGFIMNGTVASDAGTSATISIGSDSTSNQYVNAYDIKTNGASGKFLPAIGSIGTVSLANATPRNVSPKQIWAKYTESGTASTTGGPWTIDVLYVA